MAVAEPSRLVIFISSDLDDGKYTLTVTTQYNGTTRLLANPRSTSQTIYVGEPHTPGGGDGDNSGRGTFRETFIHITRMC
ncbi:MAG TPA: DUF4469 domain-containing protein [Candidatus Bacteroides merdipullorum]|uniref:DUF4469 domain-containing protein n=1 Tax=Candidatus Bacteroides merdipullorum TaxID=2838474 RepID=A0A9D2CW16_9BACE|nr:DUF4469 domain-containing protein [Candidatus Bacteroides merdipullorum]